FADEQIKKSLPPRKNNSRRHNRHNAQNQSSGSIYRPGSRHPQINKSNRQDRQILPIRCPSPHRFPLFFGSFVPFCSKPAPSRPQKSTSRQTLKGPAHSGNRANERDEFRSEDRPPTRPSSEPYQWH